MKRIAKKDIDSSKTEKYTPSRTELLLEEICKSFGTELLQAYVNPINVVKLVRESKPVIAEHLNGSKKLLQFQYTKFSPLYSSRHIKIYKENLKLDKNIEISDEQARMDISKQLKGKDSFQQVTDPKCIEYLGLHRFEKELYFAVYDIEDKRSLEEKLKPFLIFNSGTEFNGEESNLYITFKIEPHFVIGDTHTEVTKNIYDRIIFHFPKTSSQYNNCINVALRLHPLDNLREPQDAFKRDYSNFLVANEVHSELPREITMGFIESYLRKFCLDKDFY